MSHNTVLGDLKPLSGTLTSGGAAFALELTDTVTLKYIIPSGTVKTKALTIANAPAGEWQADWVAGDLPEVGYYLGQIEVARAGDDTFPRTFPDDGTTIIWWVNPKID